MTTASEFALLPLERISPNPHNPRKTFAPEPLAQLVESVRAKGVLEPVLVRPVDVRVAAGRAGKRDGFLLEMYDERGACTGRATDDDGPMFFTDRAAAEAALPRYELVAGERRLRAAKATGLLRTIPALVRTMTDREAAEICVIENDQREDVPPLEQAEGYARLVALGEDAETIAVKIGRPAKYVIGRLQLTELVDELKEDLRSGKLPFGHAWLLSRLQAADQIEIRAHLYQRQHYSDAEPNHAIGLTDLKQRIRGHRLFVLSIAPWKWDDADLVPEAGSCSKCPKRSGNNPTLFDDLLEDDGKKKPPEVCTDGRCFQAKRAAFIELQLKVAAEKSGSEPLKITKRYSSQDKDVLGIDRYEIVSKKDAKEAKPGELQTAVIVEPGYHGDGDQDVGKVVQVRVKREVSDAGGRRDNSYAREQAAQRKKQQLARSAAAVANERVADKALKAAEHGTLLTGTSLLKPLALALADYLGADACRAVADRRGLEKNNVDQRGRVTKYIATLTTAAELVGLIAELTAARRSWSWADPHGSGEQSAESKAFWTAFGVDKTKLVAAARAETKEKVAASKPKKRKAVAK